MCVLVAVEVEALVALDGTVPGAATVGVGEASGVPGYGLGDVVAVVPGAGVAISVGTLVPVAVGLVVPSVVAVGDGVAEGDASPLIRSMTRPPSRADK